MTKPIEFGNFYKLLKEIKKGNSAKKEALALLLEDYKVGKDSESPYEELGQALCTIGLQGIEEYTGLNEIEIICNFQKPVWEYLKIRMGKSFKEYLENTMKHYIKNEDLISKLSIKWKADIEELESNIDNLIDYINEGIIEIIQ